MEPRRENTLAKLFLRTQTQYAIVELPGALQIDRFPEKSASDHLQFFWRAASMGIAPQSAAGASGCVSLTHRRGADFCGSQQ